MQKYNIYHRRDGRWEGRINRGKRENGRRKFQYVFGKSREQVRDKIIEVRAAESHSTCNFKVSSVLSEWLKETKHCVKDSTLANYTLKAEKHILPAFGDSSLSSISSDDIYSFIESKQSTGLSNRYICDILIMMKSVFKYAVKKYRIYNPMDGIVMPKRGKPEISLLDEDEKNKLHSYITDNQSHTNSGVALTMSTGLRIGELCALRWEDVDLEKRILTVRKTLQRVQIKGEDRKTKLIITDPKSESSKREIPLTKSIVKYLEEYKSIDDNYVISGCSKPVEPRTLQYRFAKILKNVKLPSIHFHALRHMFASTCIKKGFDVKALSEILGHSSVEITLNRYVHSSFEQKREYMDRLDF